MVESTLQRYTPKDFEWHYEHGLQVMAIQEAGEATGEERYLKFVADWINHFVQPDGTIRTYRADEYNIDQINAGKLLYGAYERTGDERYRKAVEHLRGQMRMHPRNSVNGFWHKQIYPYQMWLDGIYMAGPFLSEYAMRFNEPETFDDVVYQITLIEKHTRDPKTGLLYHAWDESKQQSWCDPETGLSKYFWGRAVGWYVMAIVDVLDHLPQGQDHAQRSDLVAILEKTAVAIVKVQDEATGLWYQILDLPEREGNYLEASASAMFVYAFAKGVRNGYLAQDYLLSARRGYHGILQNLIKIDSHGLLTLEKVCGGAGLGGVPYRDGSFEYYITEKIIPNDPKGVGPFILAALEMERAGINEEMTE
jgi:unsaturated rhamnogalacturonyl hydrolase